MEQKITGSGMCSKSLTKCLGASQAASQRTTAKTGTWSRMGVGEHGADLSAGAAADKDDGEDGLRVKDGAGRLADLRARLELIAGAERARR